MRIPATFTASDLIDAHDAAEVLVSERFRPYLPGFLLPALVTRFRDDTAEALGLQLPLLPRRPPVRVARLDDLASAEFCTLWDAVDTLLERFTACMDDPELPRLLVSLRVNLAAEWAGRAHITAAIAEWAAGQERGTILPDDKFFGIEASESSYERARAFLVARGVLAMNDGFFQVALPRPLLFRGDGHSATERSGDDPGLGPGDGTLCQKGARFPGGGTGLN